MNTFVWRDILDNSISGDKIFGGTINWIDGLYTDALYLPHTGTAGVSTIDGSGVLIGTNEPVGSVNAELFIGDYFGLLGTVGYAASLYAASGQYGVLGLKGAVTNDIQLTASPSLLSFIVPKIVFGAKTEISSFYQTELLNSTWADALYATYINSNSGIFTSNLTFNDHDEMLREARVLTEPLQALAVHLLVGGDDYPLGPGLNEPLATLMSEVTAYEVQQLSYINTVGPITGTAWGFMASMNQAVSIDASIQFANILITNEYRFSGMPEVIVASQFKRLADIDQDLEKAKTAEFLSIKLGPDSDPMLKHYQQETNALDGGGAQVSFVRSLPAPLTVNMGYLDTKFTVFGRQVTILVRSEGNVGSYDANPGTLNFIIYDATNTEQGHIEIDFTGSKFTDVPLPATGFEAITLLPVIWWDATGTQYKRNFSAAYMDTAKKLQIRRTPDDSEMGSYPKWPNTPPQPIPDNWALDAGDQLFIPNSFTITYFASS